MPKGAASPGFPTPQNRPKGTRFVESPLPKFGIRAPERSYKYLPSPLRLGDNDGNASLPGAPRNTGRSRQNADFVIVALHSHECSLGCDDPNQPRGPGDFLKRLAHEAIDSGADTFFTTGNHNLGPLELYRSAHRGIRPILYGLGNFFWSDVQELLPHDRYQRNRSLLESAWIDPSKATPYDLSAPLNKASFAHDFTFRSVIAVSRFDANRFVELRLYPIEEGYGDRLTDSGIPRLAKDSVVSNAIIGQIMTATARFGLPAPHVTVQNGVAVLKPDDE